MRVRVGHERNGEQQATSRFQNPQAFAQCGAEIRDVFEIPEGHYPLKRRGRKTELRQVFVPDAAGNDRAARGFCGDGFIPDQARKTLEQMIQKRRDLFCHINGRVLVKIEL
jgi:hypothetical protein